MNLENSWQEPRIKENKAEQFPIESMPHYLADLVQALALEVQVPIELPYFAAMSLLATATSGSVEVLVKGRHTEQLSFYSIIALGSGNRKSEVVKTLKAPHLAFEKDLIAKAKPVRKSQESERKALEQVLDGLNAKARKGLTDSLRVDIENATQKIAECNVIPLPRIFADNVTPEKHAALIAEHGSSTIVEPEGGFFEGLSRYGTSKSPQVDYLNKSYGGEPFRVDRQGGDSVQADKPHCVLHFSIQPHIVESIRSNSDFMGTGFANRFLYSLPQSLIGSRLMDTPPTSAGLLQSWQMIVRSIFESCYGMPVRQLRLESNAYALWRDYSEQLESSLVTDLLPVQGWASKLPGQLVRVAALYELAANPKTDSVSADSMRAALALAPYLQAHALKALTPPTHDQPAMKVLAYLAKNAEALQGEQAGSVGSVGAIPYQFHTRSVQLQFNKTAWLKSSDQPAMTVRGILQGLAHDNWVRLIATESTDKGGRPAELWELHPQASDYLKSFYG
jgi:hypothetical protein